MKDFKINLTGIEFDVKYIDKKLDADLYNYSGRALYDDQIIKIRSDLKNDTSKATLLHEVLHVVLDQTGLEKIMDKKKIDNEFFVEVLSNSLYNMFKSNPILLKELFFNESKPDQENFDLKNAIEKQKVRGPG